MEYRTSAGGGKEEKEMITVPHTYSEWVEILEILRSGTEDEEVLAAMFAGTVEWQSGVAERFAKRLIDVVNFRMDAADDKFQRSIRNAQGQESAIIFALSALQKEMKFLSDAINLPALPEKDRHHYRQLVIQQADYMQKSLEDSAQQDRSGKLLSIVRNHKINAF